MKMLLLGAGASIEANVPGALKMTNMILTNIRNKSRFAKHGHALSFVVGGLVFDAGMKNRNPLEPEINVEDLFNAVQLLAERKNLEAAPFIGSWHTFVDELDKIYPHKPNGSLQKLIYASISKEITSALAQTASSSAISQIDKTLKTATEKILDAITKKRSVSLSSSESLGKAIEKYISETTKKWIDKINRPSTSFSNNIDKQVDKTISASQAVSGEGQVFQETSAYMIAALKDLVWISDSSKVKYLSPILNILNDQEKICIATLNYDNSIELLAQSYEISCDTGISSWSDNGKLRFENSGINLIKLHGSIDWKKIGNISQGRMPTYLYSKVDADEIMKTDFKPAVIFGSRNKLTADGPYLDLLRNFSENLDEATELVVVGYSFRDSHINVYISNWLNANEGNRLSIINGKKFATEAIHSDDEFLRALIRLSEFNPQKVAFIEEYAGEGLRSKFGTYEKVQIHENQKTNKSAMSEIIDEIETIDTIEEIISDSSIPMEE